MNRHARGAVLAGALIGSLLVPVGLTGSSDAATAAGDVAVSIGAGHAITMPTTIQPGVNTFTVTTAAKQSAFQLAQPAPGYTPERAANDIEKGLNSDRPKLKALKHFEANITLLGGLAVAKGQTQKLVVDLPAGTYWAVDTNKTKASLFFPFTVAGADTGAAMPAVATLKAKRSTTWAKKPAAIPHKGMLTFKNVASQNHFLALIKLNKGKTVKDFKKWIEGALNGKQAPPPVNFAHGFDSGVLSPGHSATMQYKLPRGDYIMVCFWPDASMGGMPHAFMGMYRQITLK